LNQAHGEKAHVDIRGGHREEGDPRVELVALVQAGEPLPEAVPGARARRAREAVEISADQMAPGMAGRRVERQGPGAREDEERAEADAEPSVEVERPPDVVPQENKPEEREIEREAMHVLEDEGKLGLTRVGALELADG